VADTTASTRADTWSSVFDRQIDSDPRRTDSCACRVVSRVSCRVVRVRLAGDSVCVVCRVCVVCGGACAAYVEEVEPEGEPLAGARDGLVEDVGGQGQEVPDQHQQVLGLVLEARLGRGHEGLEELDQLALHVGELRRQRHARPLHREHQAQLLLTCRVCRVVRVSTIKRSVCRVACRACRVVSCVSCRGRVSYGWVPGVELRRETMVARIM
jgi:hypothetical protein